MARDAIPYVVIPLSGAAVCLALGWTIAAILLLLVAGFMAYFFRDPERQVPSGENLIISPADGKVVRVAKLDATDPTSPTRVSIFLSVFDVHINRAPITGQITDVAYHPGTFKAAFADDASVVNEQSVITIQGAKTRVVFKQIAGLLARRIVFRKQVGDWVAAGERVGLIKFGSRVDVLLPPEVEISVQEGDHVTGGNSILGRICL
ncbi:MAG: phosphatidylserine decarboxylase family protein [Acidobacteriota bacterium]|nr:phosphatidylserine decarboxylase family protein [Blastocatellia bacterium]MDW8240558.1 phosphatidylserine decarboxylase family protein [Acidobacteriota bacterium]